MVPLLLIGRIAIDCLKKMVTSTLLRFTSVITDWQQYKENRFCKKSHFRGLFPSVDFFLVAVQVYSLLLLVLIRQIALIIVLAKQCSKHYNYLSSLSIV